MCYFKFNGYLWYHIFHSAQGFSKSTSGCLAVGVTDEMEQVLHENKIITLKMISCVRFLCVLMCVCETRQSCSEIIL